MKRERKITKKDIKEIAKKYDLDPVDIQDIVNDMESDGIRVTREDIEDMYLNQDIVNDMESDGIRVTREDIEDMYLNGDLF